MNDRHIPMRRCIGCMKSYPQNTLIRISFDGKSLNLDIDGKKDGRGAYLCKNDSCIKEARKRKSFNRTFKHGFMDSDIDELVIKLNKGIRGGI